MRAAIYHGEARAITIETVPDPMPLANELLVEIARCGICGSDVAMTSGGPFDYPAGRCFGHEFSGTVVAMGRDAEGWRVGDRLAAMPMSGCGVCEPCREGRLLFCQNGKALAAGFAEYLAIPVNAAVKLPQTLSFADGAMVEPMACGLRALTDADMRGGEQILVLGAGSMAMAVVWWARRLGAGRIIVASRSARRREIAHTFGADHFHSFAEDDPAELQSMLGAGAQIVAECVGREGMLDAALQYVRLGGHVICMGMCMTHERILPAALTFKEAHISFPLAYSAQQFTQTARAFDESGFNPDVMVSDTLPLEGLDGALRSLRSGHSPALKIQIDPGMAV